MAIIIADLNDKRYEEFKTNTARKRSKLQGYIATLAAGDVESDWVLMVYRQLNILRLDLQTIAVIPGVDTFVKNAESNQSYVLTDEIAATVTEIDSAIDWVDTTFPASGGYLLMLAVSNGVVTLRSFTPAATSGFRSVLQDIVASIDAP